MTFVGRVLVVMAVVLALMVMGFAGAVYSVQQNWRAEAQKFKDQATKAQSDLATANQRLAALEASATAAAPAATQAVQQLEQAVPQDPMQPQNRLAQLEALAPVDKALALLTLQSEYAGRLVARNSELNTQRATLQESLTNVQTERDSLQIAAERAQTEATQRQAEARAQRERVAQLRAQNLDLTQKIREFEDQVFQFNVATRDMTRKQETLLGTLADYGDILRKLGVSTNPQDYRDMLPAPPDVQGKVLNYREGGRGKSDLVEISLGSDDGLLNGHQLYVYDKERYLGRITIIYVTPDRAVGAVNPDDRAPNGKIQKGDYVSTKL